ncbi:hypothetical protein SAMD00019534_125830, partial [Acytostelium subglobosum LB1]|uniref:hypothetical protein n=1 Tax=Acytostelium subglobosum LB1 TaxID=1410327 RepID=UPI000644F619
MYSPANLALHYHRDHPDCSPLVCTVCKDEMKERLREANKFVPLDDIAAVKDLFMISDHLWKEFLEKLCLNKKEYSLDKVKALQQEIVNKYNIKEQTDGTYVPLTNLVRLMLKEERANLDKTKKPVVKVTVGNAATPPGQRAYKAEKIFLKISIDGCTLSNNQKLVIGCVQLIYASKTKMRVKCPYDSHIFLAYVGDELHQTLTVQLENFISELRQLLQGRQKFFMTSDDIKDDNEQSQDIRYSIEPVVVADMALLLEMFGLYAVWMSQTKYRCPWCNVTKDQLHDCSIPSHQQRLLSGVKPNEKNPALAYGHKHHPILDFLTMKSFIPDLLHVAMSLIKLQTRWLLIDIMKYRGRVPLQTVETDVWNTFKGIKLSLIQKGDASLVERFRHSRVNFEECKQILFNYEKLIDLFKRCTE